MKRDDLDNEAVIDLLGKILGMELAGVVRYTHYSLMVFGHHRLPIVQYLRGEATESLNHAQQAGEMITHLGGHPSLAIGPLLETHKHDIGDILKEALEHELLTLGYYRELLATVEGKSVLLEEYARELVRTEELHVGEVDKMLRQPGDISVFAG